MELSEKYEALIERGRQLRSRALAKATKTKMLPQRLDHRQFSVFSIELPSLSAKNSISASDSSLAEIQLKRGRFTLLLLVGAVDYGLLLKQTSQIVPSTLEETVEIPHNSQQTTSTASLVAYFLRMCIAA